LNEGIKGAVPNIDAAKAVSLLSRSAALVGCALREVIWTLGISLREPSKLEKALTDFCSGFEGDDDSDTRYRPQQKSAYCNVGADSRQYRRLPG
jgi:hypothetical protein